MRRNALIVAVAALLLTLVGCGGSGGRPGTGGPPPSDAIMEGTIGASGGELAVVDSASPFFGMRLRVPPGALAADEAIRVTAEPTQEGLPQVFRLDPTGLTFAAPVELEIKFDASLFASWNMQGAEDVVVVHRSADGSRSEVLEPTSVDLVSSRATVNIQSFSFVFPAIRFLACATSGYLMLRGLAQENFLGASGYRSQIPPLLLHSNPGPGRDPVLLGKETPGSDFWSDSKSAILVHGMIGDGESFTDADFAVATRCLVHALRPAFDNIYVYQYPWPLGVRVAADELYSIISTNWGPSTDVTLIGHSMGGLVVRHCVERAVPPPGVTAVVTIATPNEGAVMSNLSVVLLDQGCGWPAILPPPFLQDLSALPDGVAYELAQAFPVVDLPYLLVAGDDKLLWLDLPGCADGVVSCDSALGSTTIGLRLPIGSATAKFDRPGVDYGHTRIHREAAINGVGDRIISWLGMGGELSFRPLDDLPGGVFSCAALGISPEGGTCVGFSIASGGQQAATWDTVTGRVSAIDDLPGGIFDGGAWAASVNAGSVVGYSFSESGRQPTRSEGGAVASFGGDLPSGVSDGHARTLSADGSVVHGTCTSGGVQRVFRCDEDGCTLVPLGSQGIAMDVYAASADGETAVGQLVQGGTSWAYLWRKGDAAPTQFGDLPGGSTESFARGISPEGSVVVGRSIGAQGWQAFFWTQSDGLIGLPIPDDGGSDYTGALGACAGGRIIVGWTNAASGDRACYWLRNGSDAIDLKARLDPLFNGHPDEAAWDDMTLLSCAAISADGRVIVGQGMNGLGDPQAWAIRLPAEWDE